MSDSDIVSAFVCSHGRWKGCYWPTQFGMSGLNLNGLNSSQAQLMARSTAGAERAEWKAAMRWLEQVELDAREAEEEACLAADLAIFGQFQRAVEHIGRACALEARYKNESVWQPLRNVIEEHLKGTKINRFDTEPQAVDSR